MKYGVFDYLLKPCRPDDILECVSACRRRIAERRRQESLLRGIELPYYTETKQRFRARVLAGAANDSFAPPDELRRSLLEAIRNGDPKQAERSVEELFRFISGGLYGRQPVMNHLFSLFLAVVDLREECEPLTEEVLRWREYPYLSQFLSLREVQQRLSELACDTAELYRGHLCASPVIREVMLYIKAHYSEEIELKMLSDTFHLTPAYLSAAFKKQVGMNYLEFMNRYRVSRAGKELAHTQKKIYQIARRVGSEMRNTFPSCSRNARARALPSTGRAITGRPILFRRKPRRGNDRDRRTSDAPRSLRPGGVFSMRPRRPFGGGKKAPDPAPSGVGSGAFACGGSRRSQDDA